MYVLRASTGQSRPVQRSAHSTSRCWLHARPLVVQEARLFARRSSNRKPVTLNLSSSTPASLQTSDKSDQVVQELIDFLKEDLKHLFDEQGIDKSKYDASVDFQDPITKYSNLDGYLFNIQFLRRVFDPTFTLHDIRRTGTWEITYRWTMTMRLLGQGGYHRGGAPRLVFTGTSIMGVNPETGRFKSHYDTWDAISQQQFFSAEAFTHLLSQVFDVRQTPSIETPSYQVLRKAAIYEVRRYEPFLVAEAPMNADVTGGAQALAGGVTAFRALAGYLFGGNQQGESMAMTTPVFTSGRRDRMQFVLPSKYEGAAAPPSPLPTSGVETKQVAANTYACIGFGGIATPEAAAAQEKELRRALERDGLETVPGQSWLLAQYNDPGTLPPFRRNEVLIPLQNFKLW